LLRLFNVTLENSRRNPTPILPEGKSEIGVTAEGGGNRESVFIGIVNMDPPGGGLLRGLVDGLKAVPGKTLGRPLKEVPGGCVPCHVELTDAYGIRKNAHSASPLND
jgi:hypothetical protein